MRIRMAELGEAALDAATSSGRPRARQKRPDCTANAWFGKRARNKSPPRASGEVESFV